jgi:endonuclease/exonuclease/phosphatase family metal-dependent hydrolase
MKTLAIFVAILFLGQNLHAQGNKKILLKVMTYNIHHGNPPAKPGKIELDDIATIIKEQNPDLVALQEVDVNTKRSNGVNQAEYLAKILKMHFYFGKAIDFEGGEYGVAILSKQPILETKLVQLPQSPNLKSEARVLALAKIKIKDSEIWFACTHLDAEDKDENRLLQIAEINAQTAKIVEPLIMGGDFNANESSAVIKLLDKQFTRTCNKCSFTIPVNNPTETIDFIVFRKNKNMSVKNQQTLQEHFASDHLPVEAVVQIVY